MPRVKVWWWWTIHLWVEGAWELIAAAVLAFVLSELTGVERSTLNKYLYAEVALTLFTGIIGTNTQDFALQVTMGPIYDRTKEHLGSADTAIIMMRRLLMRLARELEAGVEPFAAQHGEILTVRSAGFLAPAGSSFVEMSEPLVRQRR